MKIKHLLAVALMAIGGSAWAQEDVYKDVTEDYVKNAGFEGTYTHITSSGGVTYDSRSIQDPEEWTVNISNPHKWDASLLTSTDPQYSNVSSNVTLPYTGNSFGDKTYVVRLHNAAGNQQITLTQTKNLPAGCYRLSGKIHNNTTGCMRAGLFITDCTVASNRAQVAATGNNIFSDVNYDFDVETASDITFGVFFTHLNKNGHGVAAADNIKLQYNLTKTLSNKIDEANKAIISGDESKWARSLNSAIEDAENKNNSQDADELETALASLNGAIETYKGKTAIINSLINVRKEIARAEAYSVVKTDNATSYAAAIQSAKDAIDEDNDVDYSNVILAMQNFKVEDYTWVNETYTEQYTGYNSNSMNIGMQDASDNKYGNNSGNYRNLWTNYAYDCGVNGKVTLPAGDYVLKCIGRASVENLLYLQVKIGDNEATKVYYDGKGSLGIGVNTDGEACFETNENTFANDNKGYGWEWRFITFHLDESAQVELGAKARVNNTWVSVYNPVLYMTQATKDAIDLADAKDALQAVIDEAPSHEVNVGTGAFQIPTNTAATYNTAKIAAQSAHDAQDATLESLADAQSTFEAAITTFNAATLNAPADGKKYNFTLGGSNSWAGKAITYIAGGRNDQGEYGVSYETAPNSNYAQAFTMTQVEGNQYKMSQTDVEGNERYLCTGTVYGGNNNQIRTTTNSEDALVVEIVPTNEEGIYNIKNTAANANIGSKDNGVYTKDGNGSYVVDFSIAEATQASANFVITAAKYGTFIAPFNAEKPEGVTLYTCASVENEVLTLEEADAIVANTPYIVYSESVVNETLEGWGLAKQGAYTEGLLTGAYATTDVPEGSYILLNGDAGVGFYVVEGEYTNAPKVNANRCYLTAPAGSKARAFRFDGDATGIQNIEVADDAAMYNVSGVRVNSNYKGIVIKGGKKYFVK